MKLIHFLYVRFGILIWLLCLAMEGMSLNISYHAQEKYHALKEQIKHSEKTLGLAAQWKLRSEVTAQKITQITQDIQKLAQHFDTIQVTFYNVDHDTARSFCEMTMTFTLKHDDIFWKFFHALHHKYRGRIQSTELSLCKEEIKTEDMLLEHPNLSSQASALLKGKYIARWYYF